MLRSVVKMFLPLRTLAALRAAHRRYIFERAMQHFIAAPEACVYAGNSVISDLVYGWGNDSWSALDEYLASCVKHALHSNGPILECGSGLSTILVGVIAKQRGINLWSLEHSPEWAAKTQEYLDKYELSSAILCVKPLRDYTTFSWYDPPLSSMPNRFGLVICDGPPADTDGGRSGLVAVMRGKLKTGTVILLDDAIRIHEREIAKRWRVELGTATEFLGQEKPYIKLTILGKRWRRRRALELADDIPLAARELLIDGAWPTTARHVHRELI